MVYQLVHFCFFAYFQYDLSCFPTKILSNAVPKPITSLSPFLTHIYIYIFVYIYLFSRTQYIGFVFSFSPVSPFVTGSKLVFCVPLGTHMFLCFVCLYVKISPRFFIFAFLIGIKTTRQKRPTLRQARGFWCWRLEISWTMLWSFWNPLPPT